MTIAKIMLAVAIGSALTVAYMVHSFLSTAMTQLPL